jgi:hypothetical protein
LVTFDEDHGAREAVAVPGIDVVARGGGHEARWEGATNADGVAEMRLALPADVPVHIDVRAGGKVLAAGDANAPTRDQPAARPSAWSRFARREGAIALDVAVLGQRAASGFPATLWVRATDRATHAPLAGVTVEAERDSSFAPATASARTDERGWAQLVATPIGFSVSMILHAHAEDGRAGEWAGALFVSPGAAQLGMRDRVAADEEPEIDVVVPTVRTTAYVEIDDARGRAWAAVVPLEAPAGAMPSATVRAPKLEPGLYWAIASDSPAGGARLGPGTIARPFFVAASDEAALAFGTDAAECAPPRDEREAPRVVGACLALAVAQPVPRWIALDGFALQQARDAQKRGRGLTVALAAIFVAVVLETLLILRAAVRARTRLRAAAGEVEGLRPALAGRAWALALALLVALLGFALLAAFLVRVG